MQNFLQKKFYKLAESKVNFSFYNFGINIGINFLLDASFKFWAFLYEKYLFINKK